MTDWPLVVAILGFLFGVLCATGAATFRMGSDREKIRVLEVWKIEAQAELRGVQSQLADGRTSFAEVRGELRGMNAVLGDIKSDVEKLLERA